MTCGSLAQEDSHITADAGIDRKAHKKEKSRETYVAPLVRVEMLTGTAHKGELLKKFSTLNDNFSCILAQREGER